MTIHLKDESCGLCTQQQVDETLLGQAWSGCIGSDIVSASSQPAMAVAWEKLSIDGVQFAYDALPALGGGFALGAPLSPVVEPLLPSARSDGEAALDALTRQDAAHLVRFLSQAPAPKPFGATQMLACVWRACRRNGRPLHALPFVLQLVLSMFILLCVFLSAHVRSASSHSAAQLHQSTCCCSYTEASALCPQEEREDRSGAAPMVAPTLDGAVFGDFTPLEDDEDRAAPAGAAATTGASGGAYAGADGTGAISGELPWARASRSIRSPLLRLHNGALLLIDIVHTRSCEVLQRSTTLGTREVIYQGVGGTSEIL